MKRYCLALDLKDDPALIAEYEEYHRDVWPGIKKSITDSGITNMEIYRFDNHLFMIMETEDAFTFERKATMDTINPEVQQWETLMWKFQQPIKNAKPGQKWVLMDKIFELNS
ncbi:MAG TPA: L-rhamnose mutarotase [Mucilaginibacter sp.]|jgi:L-rhamnose mutarotase|nr:L-rhamnose mutarotase [Mucilaginibacter sp.]